MKKIVSIIVSLALVIGMISAQFAVNVSAATTYRVLDNIQYFKVNGRNIEKNQLDHAGSSLEWSANCSGDVKVTVTVSNAWNGNNYFTAYVDGQRVAERFECTNGSRGSFTIAKSLAQGNHTFKFARQTQPADGLDVVESVNFTGSFNSAPSNKNSYIEVIGDSITCGDGAYQAGGIQPIHSDATQSYAYLTADALGSDLSVVAQGGAGVILNYSVNLKDMYPYTSYYRNKTTTYTPTRTPNVVVINLMTNDINRFGSLSVSDRNSTMVTLKENAKTLLNQVIANYSNKVPIVWCYGMMVSPSKTFGDSNNTTIPKVIAELQQSYSNLYSLELPYNTAGGGGHPSAAGQANAATTLTNFINSKGWITGGGTVTTAGPDITTKTTTTTTTSKSTVPPTTVEPGKYPAVPSYNGQAYKVGNIINAFDKTIDFKQMSGDTVLWQASSASGEDAFSGMSMRMFTSKSNYDIQAFVQNTIGTQSNYPTTDKITSLLKTSDGFRFWMKGSGKEVYWIFKTASNAMLYRLHIYPSAQGGWFTVHFDRGNFTETTSAGKIEVNMLSGATDWSRIDEITNISVRLANGDTVYMDEWQSIVKDNGQTTTSQTIKPTVKKGDVNGDGEVNVADVQALLGLVQKGQTGDIRVTDMNNDGKVDIIDVNLLLNMVLKG